MIELTEEDRAELAHWTIGRRPLTEWLASNPVPDKARARLVRLLDRCGPASIVTVLLGDYLGIDPASVYAENWPRKAARLAAEARARGDHPHADALHTALVAFMFCINCGRPLNDPLSITRGIGPDCWTVIDPEWRAAIERRLALPASSDTKEEN